MESSLQKVAHTHTHTHTQTHTQTQTCTTTPCNVRVTPGEDGEDSPGRLVAFRARRHCSQVKDVAYGASCRSRKCKAQQPTCARVKESPTILLKGARLRLEVRGAERPVGCALPILYSPSTIRGNGQAKKSERSNRKFRSTHCSAPSPTAHPFPPPVQSPFSCHGTLHQLSCKAPSCSSRGQAPVG